MYAQPEFFNNFLSCLGIYLTPSISHYHIDFTLNHKNMRTNITEANQIIIVSISDHIKYSREAFTTRLIEIAIVIDSRMYTRAAYLSHLSRFPQMHSLHGQLASIVSQKVFERVLSSNNELTCLRLSLDKPLKNDVKDDFISPSLYL